MKEKRYSHEQKVYARMALRVYPQIRIELIFGDGVEFGHGDGASMGTV